MAKLIRITWSSRRRSEEFFEDNKKKFRAPSQAGTFGKMAFSRYIIHQIGGQNDTNKNTTQRILLLLESTTIGKNSQAH